MSGLLSLQPPSLWRTTSRRSRTTRTAGARSSGSWLEADAESNDRDSLDVVRQWVLNTSAGPSVKHETSSIHTMPSPRPPPPPVPTIDSATAYEKKSPPDARVLKRRRLLFMLLAVSVVLAIALVAVLVVWSKRSSATQTPASEASPQAAMAPTPVTASSAGADSSTTIASTASPNNTGTATAGSTVSVASLGSYLESPPSTPTASAGATTAPASSPTAQAGAAPNGTIEAYFENLCLWPLNSARAASGLRVNLTWASGLEQTAQAKASTCSPSPPGSSAEGYIAAQGQTGVQQAIAWWLTQAPSKAQIVDTVNTVVACVYDLSCAGGDVWVCQFGNSTG